MVVKILNLVLIVLIGILIVTVKQVPKHISEYWLEDTKNKNTRQLQVESYFKEIGGQEQLKILTEWANMLTDIEYFKEKYTGEKLDNVNNLILNTLIYGSDRTVKLLSLYMQNVYLQSDSSQKEYDQLVNTAYIVSSLKEDFTGYTISPQTLLKLQITDYKDNKQIFEDAEKRIRQKIKE
ncbi:hypothetical protein [Ligilactobacillus salivarius]|uniref:Uncharacterized protein n=1 Tax=Ligilactobacillus salivarius TaxID=1624 RepID=A0A1V9R1D2_9LACO|nr:hypothetical protein [Ligilactobacillus salivarius]OQQ84384.1 hypothetical protein B6U60_04310 [Ligilactobacillus salivarius]OQQ86907.1 hypothetical protein B6U59_04385 [Ligilactobacillus salivarius]